MELDKDFQDLLFVFQENRVRYMVVVGFAYGFHAEPRGTKGLDLWIASDEENAQRVFRALAEYGAPVSQMSPADFSDGRSFLQLGMPPNRMDVMQTIEGLTFEDAWPRRVEGKLGTDLSFAVISLEDLIRNKTAVERPQDKVDVRNLRKLRKAHAADKLARP